MNTSSELLTLDEAADLLKMSADSILHQATAGFLQIYWLLNKTLYSDEMELEPVGQFPAYPGQDLEEWSTNLTLVPSTRNITYLRLYRENAAELLVQDTTQHWVTEVSTPEETLSLGETQAFTITRRHLFLLRSDVESFGKPAESASVGETPEQRAVRLTARIAEEKAKGTRAFLKVVAVEEGISISRLKQIRVARIKKPAPNIYSQLVATKSQTSSKKSKPQS
jgi:hypothetical protein